MFGGIFDMNNSSTEFRGLLFRGVHDLSAQIWPPGKTAELTAAVCSEWEACIIAIRREEATCSWWGCVVGGAHRCEGLVFPAV